MPGMFFPNESHFSPDTCECILARDESDHSTPDRHWLTSRFVVQCKRHAALGSTPADVHQHNFSKNILLAAIDARLSPVDKETPIEMVLSMETGEIAMKHPAIDDAMLADIASEVAANPRANLVLADKATADDIFLASAVVDE